MRKGVGPQTGGVPRHRGAAPQMGARGSRRVLENGAKQQFRGQ